MREKEEKEREEEKRNLGALRWCKRCSRKHRSRESCTLVAVTRSAKSGRKVTRYVHVERIDG